MAQYLEPTSGPPAGPRDLRTVADRAERAVQIAAAMTYVDQARHLLDGLHDTCHVCTSRIETVTVPDDTEWAGSGAAPRMTHTQVVIVHEEDCALHDLERAFGRLAAAFTEA